MLRHFMNSPQRLLLVKPVKLIQRPRAFSNRIRFFNRLRNVSLRQDHRLPQL